MLILLVGPICNTILLSELSNIDSLYFISTYVLLGAEPVLPVINISVSGPSSSGWVIYQGIGHSTGGSAEAGGEKTSSDCHGAAGSAGWCQSHGGISVRCSGNSPSVFSFWVCFNMMDLPYKIKNWIVPKSNLNICAVLWFRCQVGGCAVTHPSLLPAGWKHSGHGYWNLMFSAWVRSARLDAPWPSASSCF